jgi:hypothetical protein
MSVLSRRIFEVEMSGESVACQASFAAEEIQKNGAGNGLKPFQQQLPTS